MCQCDTDCAGDALNPGVCVFGICMQHANDVCAGAGSSDECGAGSRCWSIDDGAGGSLHLCWPDCDAFTCDGACDADGSCVPDANSTCDYTCTDLCAPPECTVNDDCGANGICENGACIIDVGQPPPGPVPACPDVVDYVCTGGEAVCGEVIAFEPDVGDGWWDYALNGETNANQYRSYIRRDVMQLVQHATSVVACKGDGWAGNGGNLGLGDMSEANGDIPGTSVGQPGHPEGTHVDGHDMDIAYYQVGTVDNKLRAVCEHVTGGQDQYHCTGAPTLLDVWRTALFIGSLHAQSRLRVIGVDGKVGPLVEAAIPQLCDAGWLSGSVCTQGPKLAYEEENEGFGWYHFHHHHLHVSINGLAGGSGFSSAWAGMPLPFGPIVTPVDEDPRRFLQVEQSHGPVLHKR